MPSTTRPGRRSAASRKEARTAWLMSSPALLLLALFLGIPILLTFVLSFTNIRLVSPNPPRFVGLNNFVRALFHTIRYPVYFHQCYRPYHFLIHIV